MSWQERLVSLRDLGRHDIALSTGLSVYAVALAAEGAAAADAAALVQNGAGSVSREGAHQGAGSPGVPTPWSGEGRGASTAAVLQALTSLLKGYLDAALSACPADPEVMP